jgi:nitroreductase
MSDIEKMLARRSVRKYKNEPIPDTVVQNILEAGRLAPSATNSQPWHFIVVKERESKEAFTFGSYNRFAADADLIVLGLYKPSEAIIEKYSLMDVTVALQNMVIAACVQGVASCWMGAFDEPKLRNALKLPTDTRIVGAIAFGIPDGNAAQPPKRPLSEVVHFEEW